MDVSIIIPVYNVSPYIEDCLGSVMRQSYSGDMECIIVDDCGTDDSIAIAQRMITSYVGHIHFHILHHKYNQGLSAARNSGTIQAVGDYLYYLDGDDEITEDCILTLMMVVEKYPYIEMVQGNNSRLTNLNKSEATIIPFKQITIPLAVSNDEVRTCFFKHKQIIVSVWNKLLSRDFIIANNLFCQEGLLYEDVLWIFCLLKHISSACFLSNITYYYKQHPNSIVSGIDKEIKTLNYSIIHTYVLTHLTQGREKEEINYYANRICINYVQYSSIIPESKNAFLLLCEMVKLHGVRSLRFKLKAFYIMSKVKCSRLLFPMLIRLMHPVIMFNDFKGIYVKLKKCN